MAKNGSTMTEHTGKLIEIKGVVVDAVFPERPARDLLGARDHPPRRRPA